MVTEPTVQTLLTALPAYRDEWVVIHPNQQVHDIINEVLDAHEQFALLYKKIALYFDADTVDEICDHLYRFCKKNLRYREESENEQSTAVPQGLLRRGHCDCKGYAGFCGGVLDAIRELTGKKIDWCYRFASYHMLSSTPHHVFIVVRDGDQEIWIDPTPNADIMTPIWQTDKKISGMPLIRNIAGVNNIIGAVSITLRTDGPGGLNFTGVEANILRGMWPNFLGLSDYRDMEGDSSDILSVKWQLAQQINDIVHQNGGTHTVDGDFVQWIYDNSVRSWNFLFPGGVEPTFDGKKWIDIYQTSMHQSGWPYFVVTGDGRLTIDHDVKVDDYHNAGVHILTAWGQDLINRFDGSPYPLKPRAVKEFTQNYTGNPGNVNANLFREARGSGFFADVGHAVESAINFVKDAVITVVGAIPRNAFLGLVGLNVFHMATDLQNSIATGHWAEIAKKWQQLGGNPDKLQSTIEHGAGQPAIEDATTPVDPSTVSGVSMGVVQVAAILAAAAPIIAALLKFLNKDGKLNTAIQATEAALQAKYPDADFSFLNGALTQGGKEVIFQGDPRYSDAMTTAGNIFSNPLFIGGAVGALSYLVVFKRERSSKRLLFSGALGLGAWYLWKKRVEAQQPAQVIPLPSTNTSQSNFQNLLTALENSLPQTLTPTDNSYAAPDYSQLTRPVDYATV